MTTTAAQLISKLGEKGIKLWLDNDQQLRFKAPKGALTADLKSELITLKPQVIEFLAQTRAEASIAITPIDRSQKHNDGFALSFSQQRFWFLDKLQPGDPSLHIPATLEITGDLKINCLNMAFQAVIEKHESFRTYFSHNSLNEVKQCISDHIDWQLELSDDLSELSQDKQEKRILQIMQDEATKPFDLQSGEPNSSLIRAKLIKISASDNQSRHVLFICLHHIIADGWSIALLVKELSFFYKAFVEKQTVELNPLPIQYIDFSEYQRQWIASEDMQKQLDYWKNQVDDIGTLALPTDRPRPKHVSHHGANLETRFSAELSQQLHQLSQTLNVSYFSLMLSAYKILLMRYSGQHDICVGTPIAGRNHSEIQQVIGCFINLLALRNTISPDDTIASLTQKVQNNLLNAQQNQDIPFDIIAETCNKQRSSAHTPIFQVLFTLNTSDPNQQYDFYGLHVKPLLQPSFTAKYDMQLHIDESPDDFSINIEYNTDLFDKTTIERFSSEYIQLLHSIVLNQSTAVNELNIFSQEEIVNLTSKPTPKHDRYSLLQALERHKNAKATAVNDGNRKLSFKELHGKANALANYLYEKGVRPDTQVGILLPASAQQIIALLAVIKNGACYVPMDTNYPTERLQHMASNANMQCIITETKHQQEIAFDCSLILLNETVLTETEQRPEYNYNENSLLYLIYTSGSTGLPKAASVSYANEMNLLPWYTEEFGMNSKTKVLVISSFGFDLTQKNLLGPLIAGSEIHFTQSSYYDPAIICETIQQRSINWINCAPSAFYPIVSHAVHIHRINYLQSLNQVFLGGEPIQLEQLKAWINDKSCSAKIINMYGPTECTDIATTFTIDKPKHYQLSNIPIGSAIPGVNTYVLDEKQQLLPRGAIGELYIGGMSVGQGYFGDHEKTGATFIDNPFSSGKMYRTHDLVRFVKYQNQWQLEFLNRADDQIKIRGFRVELGEINSKLSSYDNIEKAQVFAKDIHNEQGKQQRLVAYVITSNNNNIIPSELRKYLADNLPDYMIPSAFVSINEFPLSPNGKIDKNALPDPTDLDFVKQEFVTPRNLTESRLCELFNQILKTSQVSVHDNFFELGGHSLLATQLIHLIADEFGIEIPLKTLFDKPSIAEIAEHINAGNFTDNSIEKKPIAIISRDQDIPLSFAQERLWIIEQFNPVNSAYNIPAALKLQGKLNIEALEKTLTSIVNRHESLRTRFKQDINGNGIQCITNPNDFILSQVDLSNEDNPSQTAQQFFDNDANTGFNIEHDSLFRATLLTLGNDQYVLVCCMHHIISDGWSMTLLQNELVEIYTALNAQQKLPLEPLPYQYADFSAWQRELLTDDHIQQHLEFWTEKLHDAPKLLNLTTDRPRPEQQTFNGSMHSIELDADHNTAIRRFSQNVGSTHFNILLACYTLLLSKHSQQDDICIGTPVSGREDAQLQQLIGYFVNAVVLRCQTSGNPTFKDLLERLQDTSLAAFAHQDIPIEQVLDKLQLERNLSYAPVAQVGFSFISENFTVKAQLPDLDVSYLDFEHVVAKYDITMIVIDNGDNFTINFEYNTDLFEKTTIELFATHFKNIINFSINNAELGINNLQLADDQDLQQALMLENRTIEEILPLTAMQHDMVASQAINPTTLSNTLGYRAQVDFVVDPEKWHKALQMLAQQQRIMRTGFAISSKPYTDFAYQYVLEHVETKLEIIDKRNEPYNDELLNQWVDEFIYRPEHYSDNQFIRYGLLQLQDDKTILLMSSHHALLDGIAVVMIATQTARCYEAILEGSNSPHIYNADHFSPYIKNSKQAFDNQKTITFWQEHLKTCEPLSFSPLKKEKYQQQVKQLNLAPEHWQAIKKFCRSKRITSAQYFKILYSYLISQYCRNENDFYITEFNAGRSRDNMLALGCYFEQLPFVLPKALFDSHNTIDTLINYARQFKKSIKGFDKISAGQTQKILQQMKIGKGLNFMFNYYHFFPADEQLVGHDITCIEMPPFVEQTVQFIVKDKGDTAQLDLYFHEEHFSDLQLLQRIESISAQIIQGKEKLQDLSLISAEEKSYQLNQYNTRTEAISHTSSVQQLIERQVEKSPDATAVCDNNSTLSYKQLNQTANQLANYLKHQGVGNGSKIAIAYDRSVEAIIAILATIKAGASYVPIDTSLPFERIQLIVCNAECSFVFCNNNLGETLQFENCKVLAYQHDHGLFDGNTLNDYSSENLPPQNHSTDMLYVIFTSGSTGTPKGAAVSHKGEVNLLHWYKKSAAFDESSRMLIISSIGFDLTQKNLFAPLVSGGQLHFSNNPLYDSGEILDTIENKAITHINCAPSAFYPFVEDHELNGKLASLQRVIFGGETIKLNRIKRWLETNDCNATIVNHYGPTECTDIALYYDIESPESYYQNDIPIGTPNTGVTVYLLNQQLQLLPEGLTGEICIGGNGVGLGYLNQDDLNHEKFIANPFDNGQLYRTGDLGRYGKNGAIYFVNRCDFQVKLNGLRIELGEIEYQLRQLPYCNDALVILDNNRLVAYLLAELNDIENDNINQELAKHLPSYMIPSIFVPLQRWPLNANGKIDRKQLPSPEGFAQQVPYVAPNDDIEAKICSIIEQILQIDQVGIHDNFFDLGGHSLAASRAIAQIREHFELDIPLNLLFDLTTVEKLADYIKASQWAQNSKDHHDEDDSRDTGFI